MSYEFFYFFDVIRLFVFKYNEKKRNLTIDEMISILTKKQKRADYNKKKRKSLELQKIKKIATSTKATSTLIKIETKNFATLKNVKTYIMTTIIIFTNISINVNRIKSHSN